MSIDPSMVPFGSLATGTSATKQVTLTNAGNAPLTGISAKVEDGQNHVEFSATDTCNGNLTAGNKCVITVTFKPMTTGEKTAMLDIADNASDTPQKVTLSSSN